MNMYVETQARARHRAALQAAMPEQTTQARPLVGLDLPTVPPEPGHVLELTDRFVREADAPDHGHVRLTVEGRQDDLLRFGSHRVHPNVVRSVLFDWPAVVEYHVRQTAAGLEVSVVFGDPGGFAPADVAGRLRAALEAAGIRGAEANVEIVDAVERHPLTGKARRFITPPETPPLSAVSA